MTRSQGQVQAIPIGDLLFQPVTVPGAYFVYYLTYKTEGSWYFPTTVYLPPSVTFAGEACRGEFYAWQVGLYASGQPLQEVAVAFRDLTSSAGDNGPLIPEAAVRCTNLSGTDWLGRPLRKVVNVPQGKVQALWFGVDDGQRQILEGVNLPNTWTQVAVQLEDKEVVVLATQELQAWQELARFPRASLPGTQWACDWVR